MLNHKLTPCKQRDLASKVDEYAAQRDELKVDLAAADIRVRQLESQLENEQSKSAKLWRQLDRLKSAQVQHLGERQLCTMTRPSGSADLVDVADLADVAESAGRKKPEVG